MHMRLPSSHIFIEDKSCGKFTKKVAKLPFRDVLLASTTEYSKVRTTIEIREKHFPFCVIRGIDVHNMVCIMFILSMFCTSELSRDSRTSMS